MIAAGPGPVKAGPLMADRANRRRQPASGPGRASSPAAGPTGAEAAVADATGSEAGRRRRDRCPGLSGAEATSQREMMRLVAQLYYVRELGQPEIAALTGFSISKVSRLLAAARAAGVVRISVEGAPSGPTALARALSEALGVEAWVTPGHETSPALAARLCGVAAAPRLAEELPEGGGDRADRRLHRGVARGRAAGRSRTRSRGRAARRRLGLEQPAPEQQRDRPPHGRAHRGRACGCSTPRACSTTRPPRPPCSPTAPSPPRPASGASCGWRCSA